MLWSFQLSSSPLTNSFGASPIINEQLRRGRLSNIPHRPCSVAATRVQSSPSNGTTGSNEISVSWQPARANEGRNSILETPTPKLHGICRRSGGDSVPAGCNPSRRKRKESPKRPTRRRCLSLVAIGHEHSTSDLKSWYLYYQSYIWSQYYNLGQSGGNGVSQGAYGQCSITRVKVNWPCGGQSSTSRPAGLRLPQLQPGQPAVVQPAQRTRAHLN